MTSDCLPHQVSALLYLSSPAAGGATSFPLVGLEAYPRAGRLLVFETLDEHGWWGRVSCSVGVGGGEGRAEHESNLLRQVKPTARASCEAIMGVNCPEGRQKGCPNGRLACLVLRMNYQTKVDGALGSGRSQQAHLLHTRRYVTPPLPICGSAVSRTQTEGLARKSGVRK